MKQRSLKVNWFYNTLSSVLRIVFPLITVPYIARVLSPEGVGLFNFANTYVSWFALVAALGVPTYAVREIARVREDREALQRLTDQLFSITVFTTLIVSAVYLLTIFCIPKLSADLAVFLVIGFVLYLTPISIDWFYFGVEDFKYVALRSLVIKTLCVVALFVFVKTREDLLIYVVINVLNGVINNVWNYVKLRRAGIHPHIVTEGLRQHMTPVLTLFASTVAISVYTLLDTVMLGFIKDYQQVAYYSCASNITKMIVAVVTSLSVVTVPRVSAMLKDGDRDGIKELADKSFSFIILLVIPAAVGLCCVARPFVPLFYGPLYDGVILPLQILSFVIVAIGLNNLAGMQLLVAMGRDRAYLMAIVAGAVLNFAGNCALIPSLGAVGAACTSLAAETLILLLMLRSIRRETFVRLSLAQVSIKSLLGALLLVPLALLMARAMHGWPLVISYIIVGAALYFAIQRALHNPALDILEEAVRNSLVKNGFIKEQQR